LGHRISVYLQQQGLKHPFCSPNIQFGAEDNSLPATAEHNMSFSLA
jgi:hypothetical protein